MKTAKKPKCPWKPPFEIIGIASYLPTMSVRSGDGEFILDGCVMEEAKAICYALNLAYPAKKAKKK